MQIGAQSVVAIQYVLKDDAGAVIDASKAPLTYLHGGGNLIAGVERGLLGKAAGDAVELVLAPEDAYGVRDEKRVRNLPARKLDDPDPRVGGRYRATIDGKPAMVLVTARKGDYVTVDPNHPLAGMRLHFAITVVSVRAATEEELAHGHVHGPGGHGH